METSPAQVSSGDLWQGFGFGDRPIGEKMQTISCELKYCERCGALGVRQKHIGGDYCDSCAEILMTVWFPGKVLRKLRVLNFRFPVPCCSADGGRAPLANSGRSGKGDQ
jgi:hypothetical protein